MDYPEVRYRRTRWSTYLELDCWDGTCRGVAFRDAATTEAALETGRAEFDCSAIFNGFLPHGAVLVSCGGLSPSLEGSAGDLVAEAKRRAEVSDYVTPERGEAARIAKPHESGIYDGLVRLAAGPAAPHQPAARTLH